jgi:6-phosphogluconolactonase
VTGEVTPPGEPEVLVLSDPAAVAASAAQRVGAALVAAVGLRGRADLATTGGSSVAGLYEGLAGEPLRSQIPWEHVHLWWGDDRFVPPDHPLSNVLPVDQVLLAPDRHVPLPLANIHPWPTGRAIAAGLDPRWCAGEYAREVLAALPQDQVGRPVFDLVLLGIGSDGHLLSVFPGSPAIGSDNLALGIDAPRHIEPHVPRVTFNPSILPAARAILVMAGGAGKAAILARILDGPRIDPVDPDGLPAQLARLATATWLLDAAAAGELRPRG